MTDEGRPRSQATEPVALPGVQGIPMAIARRAGTEGPGSDQEQLSRSGTGQSATTDYTRRFVDETHSYIREYIRNADQKAIFFFSAASAINAFLHHEGVTARWRLGPWSAIVAVDLLAMLCLAACSLVAIGVVVPRLPGSRRGLLYFGAIAEHESPSAYSSVVLTASPDELLEEKAKHVHTLASICTRKYRWLWASVWLGVAGVAGALVAVLRT